MLIHEIGVVADLRVILDKPVSFLDRLVKLLAADLGQWGNFKPVERGGLGSIITIV